VFKLEKLGYRLRSEPTKGGVKKILTLKEAEKTLSLSRHNKGMTNVDVENIFNYLEQHYP
jgi:hypothetical protein